MHRRHLAPFLLLLTLSPLATACANFDGFSVKPDDQGGDMAVDAETPSDQGMDADHDQGATDGGTDGATDGAGCSMPRRVAQRAAARPADVSDR